MSSPSSVASSLSSFRSSVSSHASHRSYGSKRGGSDGEDRYSDTSFAAEDASEPQQDAAEDSEACGDYEDEEFEEEEDHDLRGKQHEREDGEDSDDEEYSDDFDKPILQQDDEPEASAATTERVVSGVKGASVESTCDNGSEQPEDDLPRLVEDWARHKTQLVWNRLKTGKKNEVRVAETRQHPLSSGVISSISERLLQRKRQVKTEPNQQHRRQRSGGRVAVPSFVVDRVRVQHLLALSTKPPPPPDPHQGQRQQKDSISTFCAVKTADLSAKLATMRLDDLCAKWHVLDHVVHTSSRGVLEFIASTAYQQRRHGVLRAADGDDYVFRVIRTHVVDLERTVQQAKDAVVDSKALMLEAQRILSAPDAHHCQCSSRSVN